MNFSKVSLLCHDASNFASAIVIYGFNSRRLHQTKYAIASTYELLVRLESAETSQSYLIQFTYTNGWIAEGSIPRFLREPLILRCDKILEKLSGFHGVPEK
jgi:hypothetical protein